MSVLWFLRRILVIWVALSATLGTTIAIAWQQPADNIVTRLHLDECKLPCWIGIIPGKSTVDEAWTAIQKLYDPAYNVRLDDASIDLGDVYVDIEGPGGLGGENYISVTFNTSLDAPHIIHRIELRNFALPTVAQLDDTLGPPSGLLLPLVTDDPNIFYLSYGPDDYSVMVGVAPDANTTLGWNTPITSIVTSAEPYRPLTECPRDHLQPWKGFRSPQDYFGNIGEC